VHAGFVPEIRILFSCFRNVLDTIMVSYVLRKGFCYVSETDVVYFLAK